MKLNIRKSILKKPLLFVFVLAFVSLQLALDPLALDNTNEFYVVGIHDGDTIKIINDKKETIKVRLSSIDAPELKQPLGSSSKQYLSDLIYNKKISLYKDGEDRYNRILGTIYINDRNINLDMVQNGYAWAYRQYLKDVSYIEAEDKAKLERLGIWSLQKDQIMAPWVWRSQKRVQK